MNGNRLHLSNLFSTLLFLTLTSHGMYAENERYFCKTNLFESNSTDLRFTKEVNTFDYVVIERYKTLSCCGKGYDTIIWYKDGNMITPHNKNFTTFHELKEENQTLISTRAVKMDEGNYTCKLFKGDTHIDRDIKLKVVPEEKYMGRALVTHQPEPLQYAQVGETARFFCAAFIGSGKELDSKVTWVMDKTNTFPDTTDKHRYTTKVKRDDGLIIGEYLFFKPVTKEDFATYHCTISNGDPPRVYSATLVEGYSPNMKFRTSYKATMVIIAVFTCSIVLLITAYIRWHLELHLFWKDRFGKLEDDNKEYDVFICYDQTDAEFALGILVHTLETVYQYRCFAYERDSVAGDWIPEIYTTKIRSSKRFLMVLSPALAVNSWCTYALYVAIEAMLNLHSKIICVVLQDIPWKNLKPANETNDHTLQQVLRVVKKVQWQPAVMKRRRPSMLRMCPFQNKKLLNVNLSDSNCGTSEASLSGVVLDGSKENIIDSDKCNDNQTEFGSKRFWTSLRIELPPKRPVQVTTISLNL